MTRIVRGTVYQGHGNRPLFEWKRYCLIKPEGICEWVALWLRGWKVHHIITGEKFMRKYYHKIGFTVKL